MTTDSENTGWGYGFGTLAETAPAPAMGFAGPVQVSASAVEPHIYSLEQLDVLNAWMRDPQNATQANAIITQATQNRISDVQIFARQIDSVAGLVDPSLQPAMLAQNAMNATATGFELSDALGVQQWEQAQGRSTVDASELAVRAEALVAQMMGAGKSDKEIRDAVQNLPGYDVNTAAIVDAQVQKTLATDNPFSNRNAEQGAQASAFAPVATTLLAAATLETANPENPFLQTQQTEGMARNQEAQRRAEEDDRLRRGMAGGGAPSRAPSALAAFVPDSMPDLQLAVVDLGKRDGPALDAIFDAGPGQTPSKGMELVAQMRAARPAGRELT